MERGITVGSYVHVIKRGFRGVPIVHDEDDRWRFLRTLRYLNDETSHINWQREVSGAGAKGHHMPWPGHWDKKKPLVTIHAYTLMPNHFHLLLEEVQKDGITRFVKKISHSMTNNYEQKYNEHGLFQKSFKSKIVDSDEYLQFLVIYILVKNTFELYPDGFENAFLNFENALEWAKQYPFSSLADLLKVRANSPIISNDLLATLFDSADETDFKETVQEALEFMKIKKYTENFIAG